MVSSWFVLTPSCWCFDTCLHAIPLWLPQPRTERICHLGSRCHLWPLTMSLWTTQLRNCLLWCWLSGSPCWWCRWHPHREETHLQPLTAFSTKGQHGCHNPKHPLFARNTSTYHIQSAGSQVPKRNMFLHTNRHKDILLLKPWKLSLIEEDLLLVSINRQLHKRLLLLHRITACLAF